LKLTFLYLFKKILVRSSHFRAEYPRNLALFATISTFAAQIRNNDIKKDTMKVLVINASANKERSTTLKLTKTFLEGLGVESTEVEFVTTIGLHINPCRACYACWFMTAGKCVQKDDATEVMEKIRQADLDIWSIPLYAYGVPSHCKALMDRTVSFNSPLMYIDSDGIAHHYGYEEGTKNLPKHS
jgi:multimeric flavodoxin WrbA